MQTRIGGSGRPGDEGHSLHDGAAGTGAPSSAEAAQSLQQAVDLASACFDISAAQRTREELRLITRCRVERPRDAREVQEAAVHQ